MDEEETQRYYVEFFGHVPGQGAYRVFDAFRKRFVSGCMTFSEAYRVARDQDRVWRGLEV